jgi:DMSO/TMAO reductase YedYZ heme-binding membrane subunit
VFWYSSRATGIVALLLFTAVLFLGIFVTRQGRLPGLPGFAVTSLHRNLSLLGLAFIVIHVLTAVADSYVSIPLAAAAIPLASGYERFWLSLGAIAFDLFIALIMTSLARGRMPRSWWRPIHLLAYLCWPLAFLHGVGAARDLRQGWLLALTAGCALLVASATSWRLAAAARQIPRAARVAAVLAQHAERAHGDNARPFGSRPQRQAKRRTRVPS